MIRRAWRAEWGHCRVGWSGCPAARSKRARTGAQAILTFDLSRVRSGWMAMGQSTRFGAGIGSRRDAPQSYGHEDKWDDTSHIRHTGWQSVYDARGSRTTFFAGTKQVCCN